MQFENEDEQAYLQQLDEEWQAILDNVDKEVGAVFEVDADIESISAFVVTFLDSLPEPGCASIVASIAKTPYGAQEVKIGSDLYLTISPLAKDRSEVRFSGFRELDRHRHHLVFSFSNRWLVVQSDEHRLLGRPIGEVVFSLDTSVVRFHRWVRHYHVANWIHEKDRFDAQDLAKTPFGIGVVQRIIRVHFEKGPDGNLWPAELIECSFCFVSVETASDRIEITAACYEREGFDAFAEIIADILKTWPVSKKSLSERCFSPACDAAWHDLTGLLFKRRRGVTDKVRQRAMACKRIKDVHPTWSYAAVAMKAGTDLGETISSDAVRNAYDAKDWEWKRGDRVG